MAAVASAPGEASSFAPPLRYIFEQPDHDAFTHSIAYNDLIKFVGAIGHAVKGVPVQLSMKASAAVDRVVEFLHKLSKLVDDIPPFKQPMRYGNKAYRMWYNSMAVCASSFCQDLVRGDKHEGADVELLPYLCDAFGNWTRIDYGTGHETSFILFCYCLAKLGLFTPADLTAIGCKLFPTYITVVRKLQRTYWLEPAGSHGVWSLDDYQFLVYYFGANQLIGNDEIHPHSVRSASLVRAGADEWMYLAAIQFILDVKVGAPFAEHSPMLNDIANVESWHKVADGLMKMYVAEVLGKLPVVQHLVFGTLFPASWTPTRLPVASEASGHIMAALAPDTPTASCANAVAASLAAEVVPVDEPDRAVAPWATAPHVTRPSGGIADPMMTGTAPWASTSPHPSHTPRGPIDVTVTGVTPWAAAPASSAPPHATSGAADPTLTGVAPWAKRT